MKDYEKGICPYCHREFELFVRKRNVQGGNYVEMSHFESCELTIKEAVSIINEAAVGEGL